ncbi:PREDICTED: odorant receptor 13a-like [Eufriesea mexicana]|uniref:odorant receptor 13a-like n=1 Tax=Eufriesea mexicana TaxID=516756 RepID=UPI00083BCB40|nr:PREDICTED: odorant receptor 13a-like [Eufriesea mexicana]
MNSKRDRDLSVSVTTFYMKFVGFWLASNYAEKRWRNIAISYTLFTILFSISNETRSLYFSWGNLNDSMFTICNVVTIALVIVKLMALLVYMEEVHDLISYAKKNFWHANYDSYEQSIVDNCKNTCTLFVCTFTFFAQGTTLTYAIDPFLENRGKNDTDRVLPFNMWLELPLSVTPYFEIMFTIQVALLFHVGVCYHCFDNLLCIINLHTSVQFRILQYRLANICNDNEKCKEASEKPRCTANNYMKLKNYIQQHQGLIEFCKRLECIFRSIVLGQVLLFSILICLDGYLVLMDSITRSRRIIFAFHISGCMCQLLMFTYSCDCLIRDSMNVAHAVYNSEWSLLPMDKYGKMLRRDLILVAMRSQTPCRLTANGFFVVSLETYTNILSTAVSYFTLLRNSTEDT